MTPWESVEILSEIRYTLGRGPGRRVRRALIRRPSGTPLVLAARDQLGPRARLLGSETVATIERPVSSVPVASPPRRRELDPRLAEFVEAARATLKIDPEEAS